MIIIQVFINDLITYFNIKKNDHIIRSCPVVSNYYSASCTSKKR